ESKIKTIKSKNDIEELKIYFLGKDSVIDEADKYMKSASVEEKKTIGQISNSLKTKMQDLFNATLSKFQEEALIKKMEEEKIDLSLPGVKLSHFNKHPLNQVIDEIYTIFTELGFDMVEGSELETDEYCFQKLNLPIGHPARDMQD